MGGEGKGGGAARGFSADGIFGEGPARVSWNFCQKSRSRNRTKIERNANAEKGMNKTNCEHFVNYSAVSETRRTIEG